MKKTAVTTVILLIIILLVAIISAGTVYAIWVQNAGDAKFLRFETVDPNPSIKYQIYVPVDAAGARVPGTMNVYGRNYTLTNPQDINAIQGYALVGWDGGIAVKRLELPTTYTMKINGANRTYPAVSVLVDNDFVDYHIAGDPVITEIEIPANITYIAAGAFAFMQELSYLAFKGTGTVVVGDFAFARCPKLNIIDKGTRTISGDESKIFSRS
jgi:hypothetical protein